MAVTETTRNVTYAGSSRVATIEQVIYRSDDCAHIGQLYYRLSDIYRRLEMEIPYTESVALEADLESVKKEIETYVGYLEGYDE